eukprot:scaffold641383_cov32-Prasinocladus_malaysianus.AAC.1
MKPTANTTIAATAPDLSESSKSSLAELAAVHSYWSPVGLGGRSAAPIMSSRRQATNVVLYTPK